MKNEFSACSYGSNILSKHIRALNQEMSGAIEAADIEHVHQLRVSSRRIRSTLPLFSTCFSKKDAAGWLKQIRKVTKSLGDARDSDVQIEKLQKFYETIENSQHRPGVKRLILRLQQKRDALQKNVVKSLQSLTKGQILEEMEIKTESYLTHKEEITRYPLSLYQKAFTVIQDKLEVLRSFETFIYDPENIEELHKMRIATKNLRYTMEIFTPLYQSGLKPGINSIKEAQDILGDIHDYDVWIDLLPGFLKEERKMTIEFHGHQGPLNLILPGIKFFEDHCRSEREHLYQDFISKWDQWKTESVWENLLDLIKLPTYPEDAVFIADENSPTEKKKDLKEKEKITFDDPSDDADNNEVLKIEDQV